MSFFTALDPESKDSGFKNSYNRPIYDATVREQIAYHWVNDITFFQRVSSTYEIILGKHYDINPEVEMGRKGALDYLLLPLISRKIMYDGYHPAKGFSLANITFLAVALTIEAARVGTAFMLTACLIPVIALVHCLKDYVCPKSNTDSHHVNSTMNHTCG